MQAAGRTADIMKNLWNNLMDKAAQGLEKLRAKYKLPLILLAVGAVLAVASGIAVYTQLNPKIAGERFSIFTEEMDLSNRDLSSAQGLEEYSRLRKLDLRGNPIPEEEVVALAELLPDCQIEFSVTIGDTAYDSSAKEVIASGAPREDIDKLTLFKNLETIDFRGEEMSEVRNIIEKFPGCKVIWDIEICGQRYPYDTREIVVGAAAAEEISKLTNLTQLERVDATGCTEYDTLLEVSRAMPACQFLWTVSINGMDISSTSEEINFERRKVSDVNALDQEFQKLKYLPSLKKIDMCGCGVKNTKMAEWRDTYPDVKFVWEVSVGEFPKRWKLRTDIQVFSTLLLGPFEDGTAKAYENLFLYCTDLVVLDLGHNNISDISGITNLKKLQGLILTGNPIRDFSPLAELPELVFAELNGTKLRDLTPFGNLKKLKHLDIYYTHAGADVTPLYGCQQLEYLVASNTKIDEEKKADLEAHIPGCNVFLALDKEGTKLRNNAVRSEFRLALKNWKLVESITDYQNITYKKGAALEVPRGYIGDTPEKHKAAE